MSSMDRRNATPVIILVNKENDRQLLPIGVGMSEGISISMALKKRKISGRPRTHDLFANVLGQFHMKLVKVVITDLREDTYIAMMLVECHGEAKEIDARPSDAIALALRCVAPVFVSEEVIRKGGWMKTPQQDEKKSGLEKEDILL
jgi:bifunctional DNase/RNase